MQGWLNVTCTLFRDLTARYLKLIVSAFHYLRLDNWRAVVVVVNLRMSLVYKEQFYMWFLGGK